jgi:hypothetical protein
MELSVNQGVIKQAVVKPPKTDASNPYYGLVANMLQGKELHQLSKYLGSDTNHGGKWSEDGECIINYAGNPILREFLPAPE